MMKRLTTLCMIFMSAIGFLLASDLDGERSWQVSDTAKYIELSGEIVDNTSEEPLVFASVFVTGTSIATVSNSDGEFILKVPKTMMSGKVSFAYLGYQNEEIGISEFKGTKKSVRLTSVSLPIDEVIVRSIDPISLINKAMDKVKGNYSNSPEMQKSFYREAIKQNRKYVSVSEAVLDIYKAPYKNSFDSDRLKVFRGRKSTDVKKMDTLLVKLQGGPKTSLMLDIVKNPGDILDREMFKYYSYKLTGIISIDERETYVIEFDQLDNIELPLYSGKIYIDTKTIAFAGMDFSLSEKGLPYAAKYIVKKKPSGLKVNVDNGHYLIRYRLDNDSWYLNYVRTELNLDTKWKKKLFKSKIGIMLEMAVTDRDKENLEKFNYKESAKSSDILADQVTYFEDENFWGEYNTIKPDESIEIAIEKLNKKLKRRK